MVPVAMQLPQDQVRQMLQEAIDASAALATASESASASSDVNLLVAAYESWDKRNQIVLDRAFRTTGFLTSGPKNDYLFALGLEYPFGPALAGDKELTHEGLLRDVITKNKRLERLKLNLDAYGDPIASQAVERDITPSRIFIVHGRDETARLQVELLIAKATKVEAVVLADQSNDGSSTLIEKLEEHLDADRSALAVVLMTGDDEGRLKGTSDLKPRARQNVVLELGYAMKALGRRRVVILHEPGVDIPSDINGVAYYALDPGGAWKGRLLGEMTGAGIAVDPIALM